MKFRIKYAQQIVGFFLLAALAALVVVLILMGLNQRWFARSYTFYTRFNSASGITPGMSVKLKGFEIGKLSGFQLNSLNRVSVTLQIYEEYYDKIRPDSVVELASSPLGLGSGSLNLLSGKNTLPPIEEYSFIPSTDTILGDNIVKQGLVDKQLGNDAISGIINSIEPLVNSIRETSNSVNQLLTNINGAVEGTSQNQITSLLQDLHKNMGNLDRILQGDVQGKVGPILDNVAAISGNVAKLTDEMKDPKGLIPKLLDAKGSIATLLDDKNQLYDQINQIITQVNQSMKEVRALAVYLNNSTPQISGIMEDARSTLKHTDDVLTGLSNNPLLKGGIPEKKEQSGTVRSARQEDF